MSDSQAKVASSFHASKDFKSATRNEVDTAVAEGHHGDFVVDKAMEKKLNWKCDFKLLPPLIGLFVITFLDRSNIANAKIEGMTTDLNMKANDYNMSLWILHPLHLSRSSQQYAHEEGLRQAISVSLRHYVLLG